MTVGMSVTRLTRTALAAGGCVALLAGCSSAPPTSAVGADNGGFAVFTGEITLTGEVHVQGTFTDAVTGRHETCAQYAAGGQPASTLWVTPAPSNAEHVAGHVITLTGGVVPSTDFRGPGTYGAPTAQVDDLLIDSYSFIPGDTPAAVVTLGPNASGRMTFSGLVDTFSNATESGSETWTCTSSAGSSAGASATAAPALTSTSLRLSGTATISGAYTQTARFATNAQILSDTGGSNVSCAGYARGTPAGSTAAFVGPQFATGGASSLGFDLVMDSGYHGPGTYSNGDTPALSGVLQVTIPPASAPQYDTFTSRVGSTTRLTVAADGSGSVVFTQWYSPASDSYLSGTIRWQCAE